MAMGAAVGGNLMRTLGVSARLGRVIDDSDTRGAQQVMVLSDAAWRKRFGADPGIIGRKIRRDNETREVIGVMPPSFAFPNAQREFWVPLTATVDGRTPSLQVVARLRSDLTRADARARIEASALLPRSAREGAVPRALRVVPPLGRSLNPPVRTTLYLLAGAVGFVLLIASRISPTCCSSSTPPASAKSRSGLRSGLHGHVWRASSSPRSWCSPPSVACLG